MSREEEEEESKRVRHRWGCFHEDQVDSVLWFISSNLAYLVLFFSFSLNESFCYGLLQLIF
jgi:hypothetical protein